MLPVEILICETVSPFITILNINLACHAGIPVLGICSCEIQVHSQKLV